jgi:mannose-6-phosphate isomerase-like protein (cupin superfamily)
MEVINMLQAKIKKLAKENDNFRKVIYTGDFSQLVLMSILPGEDIGDEVHPTTDQILFLVDGEGSAIIAGQVTKFEKKELIFVPAGTRHNIINKGNEPLKLYTVYSPPAHLSGTVHKTKADAQKAEENKYQKAKVSAHDLYELM